MYVDISLTPIHTPFLSISYIYLIFFTVIWKQVNDACMMIPTACDGMGFSGETTLDAIYLGGVISTLTALGLIKACSKILSLAGQPSEAVIQEVFRRALSHEKLREHMGGDVKVGHFCSVATQEGSFRFLDHKNRIYKDWLAFDANKFTSPLAPIAFPNFITKSLKHFPGFQTVAWNNGAEKRAALELQNAPAATAPVLEEEDAKKRAKSRKLASSYSGWERYWAPRRLQFVCSVSAPNDEGLLLAEVEKSQTGLGPAQSGGFTQYKTLCFVSLKTGIVYPLEGPEKPTLLSHPQLSMLFDTIPEEKRKIPMDTADYIVAEDEVKKEMMEAEMKAKEASASASADNMKS
jgi:hypothetical protein